MKVRIEEWWPMWVKSTGEIEIPDDLDDEELIDYLNEEYGTFVDQLTQEIDSEVLSLDGSQEVVFPDGRRMGW